MPRTRPAASKTRQPTSRRARAPQGGPDPVLSGVVNSVRQLVRGLRLAEQRTRVAVGLSAAQLYVLRQLAASDAASLSELAERTLTDRTSVAAVVERLQDGGLVVTERSPEDRRRVLVRITRTGQRRLQAAPEPPTMLLVSALGRLTRSELRALGTSLERLVDAMGLADEPATMLFEERETSRRR